MNFNFLKFFRKERKTDYNLDYSFLKDITLFKHFFFFFLDDISKLFIYKKFNKDEIIFREGYPIVVLYIIKSGSVKLYRERDGVEFQLAEICEKKMFGETGLFVDMSRVYSAATIEDTELIAINKMDIINFVKSSHGTAIKLLWNIGEYISKLYLESNILFKDYED
jgi:CRP/FNR family transcriptional regulator